MLKVIVSTAGTSGIPEFAGNTWVYLNYMLGLQQLGIDAYWVDRIGDVDPFTAPHSLEYLVKRFQSTLTRYGFADRYCIIYNGGERYFGMERDELHALIADSAALLNVGGYVEPDSPLLSVPVRAFIDVDPGFTQIWAHQGKLSLHLHTHHFTVGQTVGTPEFTIPLRGVEWKIVVPPVALSHWLPLIDQRCTRFSTIADWRGSQEAIYDGTYFGGKREEFIRFLQLPRDTGKHFEIALCIGPGDNEDLGLLHGHKWRVLDPYRYAGTPESYQEFIRYSRAEFSVAKRGYLRSSSGWISDRTACYLASGKPAIVQRTGFEARIPTGKGLIAFSTPEEATAAIDEVDENYPDHCKAARQLAEDFFDSSKVLGGMLGQMGLDVMRGHDAGADQN